MSIEYVAIACNRTSHAIDWSIDGQMAFAAGNFVCMYRPQAPSNAGASHTLKGHSADVTCVAFVRQGSNCSQSEGNLIISGSADKSCIVWRKHPSGQWELSCKVTGHTNGVVTLAVVQGKDNFNENGDWVATSASDGTICIWKLLTNVDGKDEMQLMQTISMGNHHMMALALAYLPNSTTLTLLAGGTDKKIHAFVHENDKFKKVLSLSEHTDWIRSIKIATLPCTLTKEESHKHASEYGCLMVATASQDRHIRIWKISTTSLTGNASGTLANDSSTQNPVDEAILALENMNPDFPADWTQLTTKAHQFKILCNSETQSYTMMLDALLMGHDDWVHSVNWQPAVWRTDELTKEKTYHQPLTLISASADKSIMVWQPDTHSESWIYKARLGEVGGATLGFYGAIFSPLGDMIVSNGYNGALHIWKRSDDSYTSWSPSIGISGHFSSVENIAWDPSGTYLLSTSLDQTTRAVGYWKRDNAISWHEIGRPQIHGYDLHCLSFIHKYQFISGADEKVLRVFSAPRAFAETVENLTGIAELPDEMEKRTAGACLPALGLSNKAIYADAGATNSTQVNPNISAFSAVSSPQAALSDALVQPPFEEHLLQHTLWPEANKLYGHGYEIISVASSSDGTLVASACKAAKSEHAAVRLWSTSTWKEVCPPLSFHTLSVTCIQFSPNGQYVLTAGRDRGWALFNVSNALKDGTYILEAFQEKAHARIIWSAKWLPNSNHFITASRDKQVKIWARSDSNWTVVATLKFDESVTMIDICPILVANRYLLAVGLETGDIHLRQIWEEPDKKWQSVAHFQDIPKADSHATTIKGLSWRPQTDGTVQYLASCSEDHSVRLFRINQML
ncbi:hypothetical protein BDV3_002867 [Batrachochytrium dendrobatidis]